MKISTALLACIVTAALSASARAKDTCPRVSIAPPSDSDVVVRDVVARDMNNWGQVVGSMWGDSITAFFWQNGQTRMLEMLDGFDRSDARAINDLGRVVGVAMQGVGDPVPVTWTHRGIARMPGIGTPEDVNNRGQIVGRGQSGQCLYWADSQSEPRVFAGLGGQLCEFRAINDRGEVTGAATDESGRAHAFVWRAGQVTDVIDLDDVPTQGLPMYMPYDINLFGVVVGEIQQNIPAADWPSFVWSRRLGARLLPVSGRAFAINDWGATALVETRDDASTLRIVDTFGRVHELGALGARVFALDLNDRFQLMWTDSSDVTATRSYFCELH